MMRSAANGRLLQGSLGSSCDDLDDLGLANGLALFLDDEVRIEPSKSACSLPLVEPAAAGPSR